MIKVTSPQEMDEQYLENVISKFEMELQKQSKTENFYSLYIHDVYCDNEIISEIEKIYKDVGWKHVKVKSYLDEHDCFVTNLILEKY